MPVKGYQSVSLDLSPRQEQIVELLARGLTLKAIGKELGISEKTVYLHYGYALDRILEPEMLGWPPKQKRQAVADWWWANRRTPEQQQSRDELFSKPAPEGWPDLQCKRHPENPLVLGVGGGAWCGLCMKELEHPEREPKIVPLIDKG